MGVVVAAAGILTVFVLDAMVWVSNHYNDTNTHERLTADFFINICDADLVDQQIDELGEYLANAACAIEDSELLEKANKTDGAPSFGM